MIDDSDRFLSGQFEDIDYDEDAIDEMARLAFSHVSHGYEFDSLGGEDRERWREAVSLVIEAEYHRRR